MRDHVKPDVQEMSSWMGQGLRFFLCFKGVIVRQENYFFFGGRY